MKPLPVPSPTKTRLAKFVQRIVDRTFFVRWSKHRELLNRHNRLCEENRFLEECYRALRKDYGKFLQRVPGHAHYRVHYERGRDIAEKTFLHKIEVHYQPLFVQALEPYEHKKLSKHVLHEQTIQMLMDMSHELARAHAKEHADQIFSITMNQYNMSGVET